MVYSVDLREKAVSLVEKGKSKVEVAEVFEIETIWMAKKESYWPRSQSGKKYWFYSENRPKNTCRLC